MKASNHPARTGPRLIRRRCFVIVMGALLAGLPCHALEPSAIVPLWPNGAPGEKGDIGEERDTTKATDNLISGRPVIRLGNVSKPTLSLFPAPANNNSGAAVMVCPGGGYSILALDLEGTEVCEWLNSIGITGV